MLNCFKYHKNVFTCHIISWNLFSRRRTNSKCNNSTCCLYYNCLPWRLNESKPRQALYRPNMPGSSISSIRRVNITVISVRYENIVYPLCAMIVDIFWYSTYNYLGAYPHTHIHIHTSLHIHHIQAYPLYQIQNFNVMFSTSHEIH